MPFFLLTVLAESVCFPSSPCSRILNDGSESFQNEKKIELETTCDKWIKENLLQLHQPRLEDSPRGIDVCA